MKATDLAIIFILITIPFLLTMKIKRDYVHHASEQTVLYNRIIDTAIEDAIAVYKNDQSVDLNLAKERFFKTLRVNFEMPDTFLSRHELTKYIPAIVSIEKDGFTVLAQDEFVNASGYKERRLIWQPKIPYSYSQGDYIYRFFLDDHLEIYRSDLSHFYKGSYSSLKKNDELIDTILINKEVYNLIKKREMILKIQRELSYHINEYNDYSHKFGINYDFFLPDISKSDWENSISDVSLLVFFQGLPIGSSDHYYNNYALGGSRIIKGRNFYVTESLLTQRREYHDNNCELIDKNSNNHIEIFKSKFNAAKSGAFPCNLCE